MLDFDLCVIGTGPAGQRAAIQAAKLGKKVAICERREIVGGVAIHAGTIPSKTFREAVMHLSGYQQRGIYGSDYTIKEDLTMSDLVYRCNQVRDLSVNTIRHQMRRNRVQLITGEASFANPHKLVVRRGPDSTTEVKSEHIIIATGTIPMRPPGIEVDGRTIITSDQILEIEEIPRTMTIVGAGVVGIEYASIFSVLGVEVTVVDKRSKLLDFVDEEIVDSLIYQMRDLNCVFRLNEEVESVVKEGPGRVLANLKSGKRIVSEVVLYSAGRSGATEALNLEAAGISADERGRLAVNDHYQTAEPHIYAVGDVIGFPSLASTSMEQGRMAACNAFGVLYSTMPHLYPYGIYSVPEVSMVGMNEEELTNAGVPYEMGIARYRETARGNIMGDDTGMLKMLFHRSTRKILGAHIIGTSAAELIHIGQAALAFDATLDYFLNIVFNYPTFAECYKVAALDCYNKVGPAQGEAPHPDAYFG